MLLPPKNIMYSGTKLVDALAEQHARRSNSELFKSGIFTLDWRSKVGSFPHPDGETIVSAGEPYGAWKTVIIPKKKDNPEYESRPEDKRFLTDNLTSSVKPIEIPEGVTDLERKEIESQNKSNSESNKIGFKQLPLNGYVPAASIRGIVRSWASKHLDLRDDIDRLLGCQKDSKFIAGKIEFLDAFPTKATKLTLDIVNPQQNFQVFHTGTASPLSLYTLGNGSEKIDIKVAIRGCRGATLEDVETAWEWVQQALSTHGIGSRTASGYGGLQAPAGYTPSLFLGGEYSQKLNFTLYSQGSAGIDPKEPEFRPTHWRGWLRSWCLRFFLGVMERNDAESTVDELLGTLGKKDLVKEKKGLVRLRAMIAMINQLDSKNIPQFYKWTGSLELSASKDILDEIILPILKIAVRVGGVGRGWRRPLHILNGKARGCHLELSRSRVESSTNSIINKSDLAGNDLSLIYDLWKNAVKQKWHHLYRETGSHINAEVFSPRTCAVYLVPGPKQNPIDPENLTWTTKETTATRGKGMELIYQLKYKRQVEVGGKMSSCSWVSIKRINGSQCQEIVCIFMGDGRSELRSQFLHDLHKIEGAVNIFGKQPV